MINVRGKGKRGEVEALHLLRSIGIRAWSTRSTQAASVRKWDLDWVGCPYAVEVKIGKSWTTQSAWRQVVRESAGSGRIPVLLARRDRADWHMWGDCQDWPSHWTAGQEVDGTRR